MKLILRVNNLIFTWKAIICITTFCLNSKWIDLAVLITKSLERIYLKDANVIQDGKRESFKFQQKITKTERSKVCWSFEVIREELGTGRIYCKSTYEMPEMGFKYVHDLKSFSWELQSDGSWKRRVSKRSGDTTQSLEFFVRGHFRKSFTGGIIHTKWYFTMLKNFAEARRVKMRISSRSTE